MKEERKYCILRGDGSGVFAGEVEKIEEGGKLVTVRNCRRLWYWNGACSTFELAKSGVAYPEDCKFTVTIDEITLTDVIEIIPCTKKAEENIKGVKEWKKN